VFVDCDIHALKTGMKVLRYTCNNSYDKGVITDIAEENITIDFLDTIRKFDKTEVKTDVSIGYEQLAVLGEGLIIKDFRKTQSNDDDLDFDKWSV
jgi:hypothetical protein